MATFKERTEKWKSRKLHQKLGDIFFWLLLIMMIIPGPRKVISTAVNKVALHLRKPSIANDNKAYQLSESDFLWDIQTAAGENIDPESLKGELVFLNFWGTFCPPCIAEMPGIQKLYNDYGDKVRFILVTGENKERVQNFFSTNEYSLPNYYGGRNMPEALSVRSIPTTFIISKDGLIVSKKVGAADWNSKASRKMLDELLVR